MLRNSPKMLPPDLRTNSAQLRSYWWSRTVKSRVESRLTRPDNEHICLNHLCRLHREGNQSESRTRNLRCCICTVACRVLDNGRRQCPLLCVKHLLFPNKDCNVSLPLAYRPWLGGRQSDFGPKTRCLVDEECRDSVILTKQIPYRAGCNLVERRMLDGGGEESKSSTHLIY